MPFFLDDNRRKKKKVSEEVPLGRFSHASAMMRGNTLLIVGGYRGKMMSDLMAYTVPVSIAKAQVRILFQTKEIPKTILFILDNII